MGKIVDLNSPIGNFSFSCLGKYPNCGDFLSFVVVTGTVIYPIKVTAIDKNLKYRIPVNLLKCADSSNDIKTRRVAPLIAYPPAANSTTMHSWVVPKDQSLCLG